jgi:error-prone DNA polymerase
MLAVLTEAVAMQRESTGQSVVLEELPLDDAATFELIRSGETMSLFQIESPGQMNLVARTQPLHFGDLIAQVALFRPGPLQGGMVHPYVLRRAGAAPVTYLHPVLEPILADTYGIILYQEQVLEICHQFAGLSLEDADEFRRLMSKWRDPGNMEKMGERFMRSAMEVHPDVDLELAREVFRQVSAFVGYGFCRSHAAAFALTVYHSAYLKAHYPAAYMAAVLEHKPGFFPMSTVLEEARRMGVRFLPVCAWRSGVRYQLEGDPPAVRIPLTQVLGLTRASACFLAARRPERQFPPAGAGLEELIRGVPELSCDQWQTLARAGAFDACLPRREALWRVGLGGQPSTARGDLTRRMHPQQRSVGPRGSGQARAANHAGAQKPAPLRPVQQELWLAPPDPELVPALSELEEPLQVTWDYATQNLSPHSHPLRFHRARLDQLQVTPVGRLKAMPLQPPAVLAVGGLVIVRQKPPTARGMVFVMLEDETGRVQVAVSPPVFERDQAVLVHSPALWVRGRLEGSGDYRSLMVQEAANLEQLLGRTLFTYDAS